MILGDTDVQKQLTRSPSTWKTRCLFALLIVGIVAVWSIPLSRPLDLPSWHEFDDAAIARNFVLEPSSILYPRIDWRGDGPGYVESEFPLYPWLIAQCYRLFGLNILYGRILSLIAVLGALICFTLLARSMLPTAAALVAVLLFGANRIVNFVSTALQPEAFMLLFYLLAVYSFLQWRAQRQWSMYGLTILALSGAILEKSPAAHLGLFFLLVLLVEEGWSLLKSPANWCLAIVSLILPILWYVHAHKLWVTYGNSLGISNENHWIGWDIFRNLNRPVGLVAIEILFVFAGGGLLLAGLGAVQWRSRSVRIVLLWFASILFYYVVTIRTTGALWAWYYHVVSVAPMAVLSGAGVASIQKRPFRPWTVAAGATSTIALIWASLSFIPRLRHPAADALLGNLTLSAFSPAHILGLCTVCAVITVCLLCLWCTPVASGSQSVRLFRADAFLCAAGIAAYLFVSGDEIANDLLRYSQPSSEMECAKNFQSMLPTRALILTSGGACADYSGHEAAYNDPHMFYWLDRKGFSICTGEQSMAKVREFVKRGARFFVAEKDAVRTAPGFEDDLKGFRLISSCNTAWLFDLTGKGNLEGQPGDGQARVSGSQLQ